MKAASHVLQMMQEEWDNWNKDVEESRRISLPTVTFREAFIRGFNRAVMEKGENNEENTNNI